jgi:hypothetical protein
VGVRKKTTEMVLLRQQWGWGRPWHEE